MQEVLMAWAVAAKTWLGRHPAAGRLVDVAWSYVLPIPILLIVTLPLLLLSLGFRLLAWPFVRKQRGWNRKVLMVVPSLDRVGGYENQARSLSARLGQAGATVVIVTDRMPGEPQRTIVDPSHYRTVRIEHLPRHPRRFVTVLNAMLFHFLRFPSFRIVHIHAIFSRVSAAAVLAATVHGKKVVAKIATEGDLAQCREHPSFEFRSYFRSARAMDRIVALSRSIRDECARHGLDPNKIDVILNGVDTERFAPAPAHAKQAAREAFGLPDHPVVLYVGRFEERKGLDFLLSHWREIGEKAGALLVLAGDGPERPRLEEIARARGIESSVRFAGLVDRVPELLAAADVFVFPSRREGVPNAVLEAMAAGLPVLGTKIGGIVDIIEDQANGLLIEKDSGPELVAAVVRLLSDPDLRARLGGRARTFVLKTCSVAVIAKRYEELYESLLARG